MPKYPNGCKVTTKNSESCKANEINLLCNEGISKIYSSAIASTDRQITEVADKFHLVKNITDRMTKLVAENYADYRQAVRSNQVDEKVLEYQYIVIEDIYYRN